MKNNDILQALGLINNSNNMSMPNAKNMGLPTIPNDPRYNSSVYTDPLLIQEVREMLAGEDYNNIQGLSGDEGLNGDENYN
jgi:hypothetical protein